MTPEEYERFKQAEKEHLIKLRELKKAVRVLERHKKIRSALGNVTHASEEALEAQQDAVERLALETARQEARLEVALDAAAARNSDSEEGVDEQLEEELRRERARALVDELKTSLRSESEADRAVERDPTRPMKPPETRRGNAGAASANPTPDREERPDKTIGRM